MNIGKYLSIMLLIMKFFMIALYSYLTKLMENVIFLYNLKMKYLLVLFILSIAFGLVPRQSAPGFEAIAVLPNHSFKKINLFDYIGKYVVLLFYPFDFTYVCPTEITSYSDKAAEFRSINS